MIIYKRIIQTPDRLVILTERNIQYRQIHTDGRPLPVDPNPTWNGYSTAKWDGDTLVVQTTGFRDDLWLDSAGNPLTNAAKTTEKYPAPEFRNAGNRNHRGRSQGLHSAVDHHAQKAPGAG